MVNTLISRLYKEVALKQPIQFDHRRLAKIDWAHSVHTVSTLALKAVSFRNWKFEDAGPMVDLNVYQRHVPSEWPPSCRWFLCLEQREPRFWFSETFLTCTVGHQWQFSQLRIRQPLFAEPGLEGGLLTAEPDSQLREALVESGRCHITKEIKKKIRLSSQRAFDRENFSIIWKCSWIN